MSSTCFQRSESISGPVSQFAAEPGLGHIESAKKPHFDGLHLRVLIAAHDTCLVQGEVLHNAVAFQIAAPRADVVPVRLA